MEQLRNEKTKGAARKSWRKPEIVEVGGVLDLTEAVGGNLSDNGGGSPPTYRLTGGTPPSD